MQVITPICHINVANYDAIISFGNKCPTATILRDLKIYKESYPFDYIPTTAEHIYKYIVDNTDFYPIRGSVLNKDNIWFGNFNIEDDYDNIINIFKRRFTRLYNNLGSKKRILFVYTSEGDCWNELGNRDTNNYAALCKIRDYIREKYKYDDFLILAVHTNKEFTDVANIINYTIKVDTKYITNDMDIFIKNGGMDLYRETLRTLFKAIFI